MSLREHTPTSSGLTTPAAFAGVMTLSLKHVEPSFGRLYGYNPQDNLLVRINIADGVAHCYNLLSIFIRNLDVVTILLKLFFDAHHQLDQIERVGVQIFDE